MPKRFRALVLFWALLVGPSSALGANAQAVTWTREEPRINKVWTVTAYAGEKWRLDPESMLGKAQAFRKDWAKGSFFDCTYGGLSSTRTAFTLDDFLGNRAFRLFSVNREKLGLTERDVFVHRISCARGLRVLYPFVTFKPSGRAMLQFEGVVYILK